MVFASLASEDVSASRAIRIHCTELAREFARTWNDVKSQTRLRA